ncbi:MAG: NUDIX domain-containing protein [archaeon]
MDPKAHYVIATAILVKDGKYLIAKRAAHETTFPNVWTVPGGKLNYKDYSQKPMDTGIHWYNLMEDLVKREVEEEVGLKVNKVKYLTSMAFIRDGGIPTLIMSFYVDDHEGKVKLHKDMSDHAWVTLEEAKDYDLIEGIYEELEMLDKHLKGEELKEWKKN